MMGALLSFCMELSCIDCFFERLLLIIFIVRVVMVIKLNDFCLKWRHLVILFLLLLLLFEFEAPRNRLNRRFENLTDLSKKNLWGNLSG